MAVKTWPGSMRQLVVVPLQLKSKEINAQAQLFKAVWDLSPQDGVIYTQDNSSLLI